MNQQDGFTLIELVMVIVIIGILAAVAIPAYIDLEGKANQAAVDGVAGALGSGSAINYAACKAGATCTTVANCDALGATLAGGLDSDFTITSGAITTTTTCTVTGPGTTSGTSATFTGHAAS